MFSVAHKATLSSRASFKPTNARTKKYSNRHRRVIDTTPRAITIDTHVVEPVKATLNDCKSVSGLKNVAERVAMFAPVALPAIVGIQAAHFGGAGIGAFLAAAHMPHAPVTVLGPLAEAILLWPSAMYIQAILGTAGIFQIGEDVPAGYCALVFALAALCLWGGSSFGVTDALIRNAQAYHLSVAALLSMKVKKIRNMITTAQADALRKVALCGPGLMMACILVQKISMANFDKLGMAGPGILGPLAALLFNPITHYIDIFAAMNYLTGVETKRSSFFMGTVNAIAGVSLATQLIWPYGGMLCAMHVALALGLFRDCMPNDSFVPDIA